MMATLLALVFGAVLYFFEVHVSLIAMQWMGAITGALFFFLVVFTYLSMIRPLQWAEVMATPRVSELVRGDTSLKYLSLGLLMLPVSSLVIAAAALPEGWLDNTTLFCIWLVFVGISIDLLRTYSSRLSNYFNPALVIKSIVQRGQADIAQGRDAELCDWIATLSETSLMSLKRHGFSLGERAISGIIALMQRFLEVHRRSLQTEAADAKVHQRTTYVLFYGFERLQLIYSHAVQEHLEPVCSHIVTSLGKVALAAAYGDISKVSFALHYIGTLADQALQANMPDVSVKANLTLLEVGKVILSEVDLSKSNVRDPLSNLVGHLEDIAKATFRRDKESNIFMLTQPIRDFKAALLAHALAERHDMKSVVAVVDNVLSDFENLQLVLNTIPPIPDIPVADDSLPEIPELAKAEAERAKKQAQKPLESTSA
ncbi:MAG: hypothetical protein Q8K75_00265 [Chlamydiales bacterium]|nr:hypothetical protein [Chlamydiales bacterium]